jgi:hypothetical protein
VTFVPGRTRTVAGLNVKLRITTMVDPKASTGSCALHPSRLADGPEDRSLKHAPITINVDTNPASRDDFIAPSP